MLQAHKPTARRPPLSDDHAQQPADLVAGRTQHSMQTISVFTLAAVNDVLVCIEHPLAQIDGRHLKLGRAVPDKDRNLFHLFA